MKQATGHEEWAQLSEYEKKIFGKWFTKTYIPEFIGMEMVATPAVSIGQMIEFLGDDYHKALLVSYYIADDEYVPINELCDALWEAVKYKLRNETNS